MKRKETKKKIRWDSRKKKIFAATLLVVVVFIAVSFWDFQVRVQRRIGALSSQSMNQIAKTAAQNIVYETNDDGRLLKSIAQGIELKGDQDDAIQSVLKGLQSNQNDTPFEGVVFIKPDGSVIPSDDNAAACVDDGVKAKAAECIAGVPKTQGLNEKTLSGFYTSPKNKDERLFYLLVPVMEEGQVIGVLAGFYGEDGLSMSGNDNTNQTHVTVLSPTGIVIAGQRDATAVIAAAKNGQFPARKGESSGTFTDESGETIRYAYSISGEANQYVAVAYSSESVFSSFGSALGVVAFELLLRILLAVGILVAYIWNLIRQTQQEEEAIIEKKANENGRFRVLLESIEVLYFEWDLKENTIRASEKWERMTGYEPTVDRFEDGMIVEEAESVSLMGMFMMLSAEERYAEDDYHFIIKGGRSRWGHLRLLSVPGDDGEIAYIMGIIVDIDDQKRREASLKETAERDSMTQLLNKETTRAEVERALEMQGTELQDNNVFVLFDIDNFKEVNDRFGHIEGDQILIRVAQILKHVFMVSDVIGRIGGDEFVVFMRHVKTREDISKTLEWCVEHFNKIRLPNGLPVSLSIGAAISTQKDTQFDDLYKNADAAMYAIKRSGKNNYAIYDGQMSGNGIHYDTLHQESES